MKTSSVSNVVNTLTSAEPNQVSRREDMLSQSVSESKILWHQGMAHRQHFIVPVEEGKVFRWLCFNQQLIAWESRQTFLAPETAICAGVATLDEFLVLNPS